MVFYTVPRRILLNRFNKKVMELIIISIASASTAHSKRRTAEKEIRNTQFKKQFYFLMKRTWIAITMQSKET